jgi:acyl-CoA synthetase (AMP-forming)/AMP-acid ligase II
MSFLSVFSPDDIVIVQDDIEITASEFENLSSKVSGYVEEAFPEESIIGIRSDNSVYGLILAVGASLAGKNVLPLSVMNDGAINDYAIEESGCSKFIGYGTSLDHSDASRVFNLPDHEAVNTPGDFIFLSSGSTGRPKIYLNNVINLSKEVASARSELFFSKAEVESRRIFYAAPVMAGIGSYLAFMNIGMVPVYTAGRPTTETMKSLIDKNNIQISTGRPALIERFASQGISDFGSVSVLVSSGQFITENNVKYITENMGISRIIDTYNASEAGIIGMMDFLNEDSFTLIDDATVHGVFDEYFEIETASSSATIIDKKIVKEKIKKIDDIVELNGRNLKLIDRAAKKVKVSGFSVSPEMIKDAFKQIPGIVDCRVVTQASDNKSSDFIILEYMGEEQDESSLAEILAGKIPSHSIPKKFIHKAYGDWGLMK